jgi:hypothetical protein
MMTPHVLVIDDELSVAESMARAIDSATRKAGSQFRPTVLASDDLKAEIKGLLARRDEIKRSPKARLSRGTLKFDDADILVIDYDLASLFGDEALMTGELLASLCRRFSFAGPVISVNRFGPRHFDLSFKNLATSRADLSVSHEDLADPGLWTDDWQRYRPWYWPRLVDFPKLFRERVQACERDLGASISAVIDMPKSIRSALPTRVTDALGDVQTLTIKDIALRTSTTGKETTLPSELAARVSASELGRWLEYCVMPSQDVVIDAPHLGALFTSLVRGDASDPRHLDELANLRSGGRVPLRRTRLARLEFSGSFPLSRPCWWTDLVLSSPTLREVQEPLTRGSDTLVFAEDTSRFHPRADCKGFVSEGLFPTRWVRIPDKSIPYEPAVRLAA